MKLHDVSILISEDIPIWPNDPGISMDLTRSIARGDNANVTRLNMGVHTGTHIDAPFHFEPNKATIDQLSLDVLIGPCRVFEIPEISKAIGPSDLEKLDFDNHIRVLFKTRNSKLWKNGERVFKKDFVHMQLEGAKFLIDQSIKLVGIDYLSIENYGSLDHATHHLLLRNNVVILEGLDLSRVSPGDYELIALPLKLKGADGSPARVVLRESND
ncbi:MAG TPA: cyclase family protein [Gammaproteobacteria bacterium]|nr:cyclase family protein [Gammaproteobacteria bacterium]